LAQVNHLSGFKDKIFNAGGGRDNSVSLCELTKMVERIARKKMNIGSVDENRKSDVSIYITDNTAIRKEIGWKPTRNLENILTDINQWMDKHQQALKEILV
ncbi:MAG: 3-beta hydroxysteroid dehydrogenase, partial [Candidatus Omnitrophota bacterium]|nr:3-beta hydroxysteroid dehydrogenase [Candidatus Omnitrophota bacterium]